MRAFFTGHRPGKQADAPLTYDAKHPKNVAVAMKLRVMTEVAHLHFGANEYMSGFAIGVDDMAAAEVLAQGLPLHAAIPMDTQWCKWPFSSYESWKSKLKQAAVVYCEGQLVDKDAFIAHVTELAHKRYREAQEIGGSMFEAIRKLHERNKFMVDWGQLGLGIWDGTLGGTCNCIDYAMSVETPMIIWRLDEQRWDKRNLKPMILECSSKGDKRFSAFSAKSAVGGKEDSIENIYQASKVFAGGISGLTPPQVKQRQKAGERPVAFRIGRVEYPIELLSAFYDTLWLKYLDANPMLVDYASLFDTFTDIFGKNAMNCQADTIYAYVKGGRKSILDREDTKELFKFIRSKGGL